MAAPVGLPADQTATGGSSRRMKLHVKPNAETGTWEIHDACGFLCKLESESTAALIVHAINVLPELVATLEMAEPAAALRRSGREAQRSPTRPDARGNGHVDSHPAPRIGYPSRAHHPGQRPRGADRRCRSVREANRRRKHCAARMISDRRTDGGRQAFAIGPRWRFPRRAAQCVGNPRLADGLIHRPRG